MKLLFDVRLTPTKEEILDGLQRSGIRRASKIRLIAQTTILALVAAWSLTAFIGDDQKQMMSLVIGVAAAVLIPVMWFVPYWQMKDMAEDAAENGTHPHMWVFENGIDFCEECPDDAYYPYDSFFCDHPKEDAALQTMVFRFASDEVIVVPKALLTEDQWQILMSKTADSRKTFSRRGK